ncbi:hypothetical protein OEZ86_013228 [Tetradesmus obliquus]|nr:hypothetical protein OEZ86_013228 [Tetradesmus obliquus]
MSNNWFFVAACLVAAVVTASARDLADPTCSVTAVSVNHGASNTADANNDPAAGTNGLHISTFSSTAVKVASGIHLSAAAVFDATAPFLPVPGATITRGKLPRQK